MAGNVEFEPEDLSQGTYGAPPPRPRGSLDGLVPDLQQQNNRSEFKRQRLDN